MGKAYTYFHDILLPVILQQPSVIYLRSVNQKRLFARKRMAYIKRAITKYNQEVEISGKGYTWLIRKATSFDIEIEFDHFIVSSRSCIEHLMQLINHVAALNLAPTSNNRADRVDIDNVVRSLRSSNNVVLKRLGNYLDKEKQKDWYKTLHKLRIEMYHNKFERFITHGGQVKIEFPHRQEVNLIQYCSTVSTNLERILAYSMKSLITFRNLAP